VFFKTLNILKKMNSASKITNNLHETLDYKIKASLLLEAALNCEQPLTQTLQGDDTELVVSLTTYNKRIHDVHLVVESIAQQTIKPNRVVLWLDESEFSLNTIPHILHRQIARGLEIRFCPDYRSYKKLIPSLMAFPESNIVTIDDDVLYPYDMLEILLREHRLFPKCVLGHRAHKIRVDDGGNVLPYCKWERRTSESDSNDFIFLTGVGGIFYPKNCFNSEVLNAEVFLSIAPTADDVWFYTMARLNAFRCKKVDDERNFSERFICIPQCQDIGLWQSNVRCACNDEQIKMVFDRYGIQM
tara:strand:+ start:494 stop:1396 length:903 start_codon:yes stop_codon:yes gene_type:complete